MSLTSEMVSNYREIRTRLRNPPNAVFDRGIDLHPTLIPITELSSKDIQEVLEPPNPIHCHVTVEEIQGPPIGPIVPRKLTLSIIEKAICRYYKVPKNAIRGTRKQTWIVVPRQVMFYLACTHTGLSLTRIGHLYKRDHTTILHAKRKISELVLVDTNMSDAIRRLEFSLFHS
jgi:hypothetical protein